MQLLNLTVALIVAFTSAGYGAERAPQANLFIQECDSGIDYPDQGDESVDVAYGDTIYHLRITHPQLAAGPHFSSPFFWVSDTSNTDFIRDFATVRSHVGGLSWHRIKGYFFAERKGNLRGYFIEDGFDNWDDGSSGLVFLHDGAHSHAWRWSYKSGRYEVTDANDASQVAPKALVKRIEEVMNHASEQAKGWPGP